MLCFYHQTDLDGVCSAAIISRLFPNCKMVGMDYWKPFPEKLVEENKDKRIIIADFCFSPEIMRKLTDKNRVVWCDHHITSIQSMQESGVFPRLEGIQSVLECGCTLVWQWAKEERLLDGKGWKECPRGLEYLRGYDLSDLAPNVLAFQYAVKRYGLNYKEYVWDVIFEDKDEDFSQLLESGMSILAYVFSESKSIMEGFAWQGNFYGLKTLFVNRPGFPGLAFSPLENEPYSNEHYQLFIFYGQLPNGKYRLTVTTKDKDFHCGQFCKGLAEKGAAESGGGHQPVAGLVLTHHQFYDLALNGVNPDGIRGENMSVL